MASLDDEEERALFAAAVQEWRESANPGGKKNKAPLRIEREVAVIRATEDANIDVIRPLQMQIAQQHAQLGQQAQLIRHLEDQFGQQSAAAASMHATLQTTQQTANVDATGLMATITQQQAQIQAQQQMMEDMQARQALWQRQLDSKMEARSRNASPRASQTAGAPALQPSPPRWLQQRDIAG